MAMSLSTNMNTNQVINSSPDGSSILSSDSSKPSYSTQCSFSALTQNQQLPSKHGPPPTSYHNHNHNTNQPQSQQTPSRFTVCPFPSQSHSSNIPSHTNQYQYPSLTNNHQNNGHQHHQQHPSMIPTQSNHTNSTDSPHSPPLNISTDSANTTNANLPCSTFPVSNDCDPDPLPINFHDNNLSLADMSLSSLYGKNLEFEMSDKNMMNPFQSPRAEQTMNISQTDCHNLNPFGNNTNAQNTNCMLYTPQNTNPFGIEPRNTSNPCFYPQFGATTAFNNNGTINTAQRQFQPPPIFNNYQFGATESYNPPQPEPEIVSFAPGRPRPGASSQIYGHTVCAKDTNTNNTNNPPTDTLITNNTNNTNQYRMINNPTTSNSNNCITNTQQPGTATAGEYVYNSNGDVIGILDSSMSVVTNNGSQYNMMRPLSLPPIDNINGCNSVNHNSSNNACNPMATPTTLSTPSCGGNTSPQFLNSDNIPPSITVSDIATTGPANNPPSVIAMGNNNKCDLSASTDCVDRKCKLGADTDSKKTKAVKTITRSTMKRGRHISSAEKPFICETCGKGYKYLCNYRSHCKIHTDDAFVCKFCNKRFGRKSNYKEHVRIHTGEAPYKCQFCDRTFKQHHGWKDHLRVHTGEKPYLCKVCGKRFTVGHNLNVHMRIHTGERPYTCNICKKSYRQKSAYNSHIKNVHGIKVQRKTKGCRDKKMQIQ